VADRSRFLHLERPRNGRAPEPEPAGADPTAERIEAVERPEEARPAAPTSSGAQLDRFGPEPEPRIELLEAEGGRQPFTRCMRCGMDSNVFATECPGCGASLDTAPQRAFNERLWQERRAEAEREARAEAERRELQARASDEQAAAVRAAAEELAREVGDRERRRIAVEEGRWGEVLGGLGGSRDPSPLGLRLLRALPGGWPRTAATALAVLAVLALLASGLAGGLEGWHGARLVLGIALALWLFVPPGWPGRWRF